MNKVKFLFLTLKKEGYYSPHKEPCKGGQGFRGSFFWNPHKEVI